MITESFLSYKKAVSLKDFHKKYPDLMFYEGVVKGKGDDIVYHGFVIKSKAYEKLKDVIMSVQGQERHPALVDYLEAVNEEDIDKFRLKWDAHVVI